MTHDQLVDYINGFNENQREAVAKQIIDSEILRKAFDSSQGKAVLNSCVDLISSNVMTIVKHCSDAGSSNKEVMDAAFEINTTYKLMTDWATILVRGSEHKEAAEKS